MNYFYSALKLNIEDPLPPDEYIVINGNLYYNSDKLVFISDTFIFYQTNGEENLYIVEKSEIRDYRTNNILFDLNNKSWVLFKFDSCSVEQNTLCSCSNGLTEGITTNSVIIKGDNGSKFSVYNENDVLIFDINTFDNQINFDGNIIPTGSGSIGDSLHLWNGYFDDANINNLILNQISSNFLPSSNNTYNVGSLSSRWANGYFTNLDVSTLQFGQVSSNLIPSTNNTYEIGSSSLRWANGYFNNLDVLNSQFGQVSSNLLPSTDNTYDVGSNIVKWANGYFTNLDVVNLQFQQLSANLIPSLNNVFTVGSPLLRWANAYFENLNVSNFQFGQITTSLIPSIDGSFSLGSPTQRWADGYIGYLSVDTLVFGQIISNLIPFSDNVYNIGSPSIRWANGYFNNLNVNSLIPVQVSTNLIPSSTNTYDLGSPFVNWRTAYINNLRALNVESTLKPSINNTYDLGTSSLRWNNAYLNNLITNNSASDTLTTNSVQSNLIPNGDNILSVGTNTNRWSNGHFVNFNVDQTLIVNTCGVFNLNSSFLTVINVIIPAEDDTISLGLPTNRWSIVYAATGTINTSDRRQKENIVDEQLGLDFITKLKPVSFQMKGKPKTSRGLIAQDVIETLQQFGVDTDNSTMIDNHPEILGLCYTELISPLIKSIQELNAKLIDQQAQIDKIFEMLNK